MMNYRFQVGDTAFFFDRWNSRPFVISGQIEYLGDPAYIVKERLPAPDEDGNYVLETEHTYIVRDLELTAIPDLRSAFIWRLRSRSIRSNSDYLSVWLKVYQLLTGNNDLGNAFDQWCQEIEAEL